MKKPQLTNKKGTMKILRIDRQKLFMILFMK